MYLKFLSMCNLYSVIIHFVICNSLLFSYVFKYRTDVNMNLTACYIPLVGKLCLYVVICYEKDERLFAVDTTRRMFKENFNQSIDCKILSTLDLKRAGWLTPIYIDQSYM